MAEWKVSRQRLKLFPHPNADRLELADVGGYQVVTEKGLYKNDQIVVFIPEKSLLPPHIAAPFVKYLSGPNNNRVRSVRLRKELSCGIILVDDEKYHKYEIDEDFSAELGITKYEPPIPQQLAGKVNNISKKLAPEGSLEWNGILTHHDVEQFRLYSHEFVDGEEVIGTEKIHGSQLMAIRTTEGTRGIGSKGLLKRGLLLEESDTNTYWIAAKAVGLFELLDEYYPDQEVQAFGEAIPVQKGFHYGFQKPSVILFDIRIDGQSIQFDSIPEKLKALWVPVLYRGPYDVDKLVAASKGVETVSGKSHHIREGIVIRPTVDRKAKKGFRLMLKILNPKYKETGEEIN